MSDKPDTLLLLMGGLGASQWETARDHATPLGLLAALCPRAVVAHVAYRQRHEVGEVINEELAEAPTIRRIVVAAHSMSFGDAVELVAEGKCDFLVAVDPVGKPFVSRMTWPRARNAAATGAADKSVPFPGIFAKAGCKLVDGVEVLTKQTPFVMQLAIDDGPEITRFDVYHNELPHDAEFLRMLAEAVNATSSKFKVQSSEGGGGADGNWRGPGYDGGRPSAPSAQSADDAQAEACTPNGGA